MQLIFSHVLSRTPRMVTEEFSRQRHAVPSTTRLHLVTNGRRQQGQHKELQGDKYWAKPRTVCSSDGGGGEESGLVGHTRMGG